MSFELTAMIDADAHYEHGLFFYKGLNGYSLDYERAFQHFQCAAARQHAKSLFMVGLCYKNGQGVKSNINKFIEYLKQSTSTPGAPAAAHYLLGAIFLNHGKQDEAVKQFKMGARLDHIKSMECLIQIYLESNIPGDPASMVRESEKLMGRIREIDPDRETLKLIKEKINSKKLREYH